MISNWLTRQFALVEKEVQVGQSGNERAYLEKAG